MHLYSTATTIIPTTHLLCQNAHMLKKLDMISYSSYDTQASPENFLAALNYIHKNHNRGSVALFGMKGGPQQK